MKLKKILIATVAVATFFGLTACTEKEAAEKTASSAAYPLTTCVVSGEELGGMGDPVVMEHEGTTVKLCCKECIDKFEANPDKYVAMVKEAQ